MMMCRGAAEVLGATFKLTANGSEGVIENRVVCQISEG